jgi:hypothetical protein
MAFVVEDGTRKTDATAYLSVADFKTHHADRNVTVAGDGTYSDGEIQGGIVQATDYIDKRFGRRFRGWRSTAAQALEWPRTDAFDDDDYLISGVPQQLTKATAEYALIALQLGPLAPIPGNEFPVIDPATGEASTSAGTVLKKSKEVVGPIEETKEYAAATESNRPMVSTGNQIQRIPEYPQADLWIEELTRSTLNRTVLRG